MAIDMWSLGCILAELLTGYALLPGEDEADQLACIIELLGMPPQKLLDQSKRAKNFISAKGYPRYCSAQTLEDGTIILGSGMSRRGKERRPPGSKELKTALKGCDDQLFLSFLRGCLEWDPDSRMTPAAALKHAWFRRRLPRPPQFAGNNSFVASTSSSTTTPPTIVVDDNPKQVTAVTAVQQHVTTVTATNGLCFIPQKNTKSTPNTSRSSNKAIQSSTSSISSGSGVGGGNSGIVGVVTAGNGVNSTSITSATANKLRVHLSSSDDSMLSLNRSTIAVHSAHRHNNHHHHQHLSTSGGGAPKLPQIQQGNTVT